MKRPVYFLFTAVFTAALFTVINCGSMYTKGDTYLANKEYTEAAKEYTKIIEKFPDDWDALIKLGYAYRGMQKFDDAYTSFNKALSLKPRSPEAEEGLRQTMLEEGKYRESQGYYQDALEIWRKVAVNYPTDTDALFFSAQLEKKRNRFEEALSYYKTITDRDPANSEAKENIAALGKKLETVNDLIGQGMAYLKKNNFDKAKTAFENALKINPGNVDAKYYYHFTQGRRFYKKGSKTALWKAIEQFGLAMTAKDTKAEPHIWLGKSYEKKNSRDYDLIIPEYEQALELEPGNKESAKWKKALKELKKKQEVWNKFWNKKKK